MKSKFGKISLMLLLGSALLIAACSGTGPAPADEADTVPLVIDDFGVTAEGRLLPAAYVQLGFQSGGEITEVLVEEGDPVEAGQVLARLERFDNREALEAGVAASKLELANAQQGLADLFDAVALQSVQAQINVANATEFLDDAEYRWRVQQPGMRASGDIINASEANLILAEDQVDRAQKEYNKYSGRGDDDPLRALALSNLSAARQQRDAIQRQLNWYTGQPDLIDQAILDAEVAFAQVQLDEAQEDYEMLLEGPDPDLVALAQERINNALAQLAAAEAALADYEDLAPVLTAPIAGTVVKQELKVGENAVPGQVAMVLADLSRWYVETEDLTEIEVVEVSEGSTVTISPDALPEVELAGVVESISEIFEERRGDITYTANILVGGELDPRLRWGMTVVVNFEE